MDQDYEPTQYMRDREPATLAGAGTKVGHFGPYRFVRRLEDTRFAERWMAVHERDLTSHVVYRYALKDLDGSRRRFLQVAQELAELDHPHIQSISQSALDSEGRGCIVTVHPGHAEGLLTISSLLTLKGGRMMAVEAHRAISQLLDASAYGHFRGQAHGPISMDQVLVDRHGRTIIELYGLDRRLGADNTPHAELARLETYSILEIGYRLLTGFRPDATPVPPTQVVKKLVGKAVLKEIDLGWDGFFAVGLKKFGGFATAEAAMANLPPAIPRRERSGVASLVRGLFRDQSSRRG